MTGQHSAAGRAVGTSRMGRGQTILFYAGTARRVSQAGRPCKQMRTWSAFSCSAACANCNHARAAGACSNARRRGGRAAPNDSVGGVSAPHAPGGRGSGGAFAVGAAPAAHAWWPWPHGRACQSAHASARYYGRPSGSQGCKRSDRGSSGCTRRNGTRQRHTRAPAARAGFALRASLPLYLVGNFFGGRFVGSLFLLRGFLVGSLFDLLRRQLGGRSALLDLLGRRPLATLRAPLPPPLWRALVLRSIFPRALRWRGGKNTRPHPGCVTWRGAARQQVRAQDRAGGQCGQGTGRATHQNKVGLPRSIAPFRALAVVACAGRSTHGWGEIDGGRRAGGQQTHASKAVAPGAAHSGEVTRGHRCGWPARAHHTRPEHHGRSGHIQSPMLLCDSQSPGPVLTLCSALLVGFALALRRLRRTLRGKVRRSQGTSCWRRHTLPCAGPPAAPRREPNHPPPALALPPGVRAPGTRSGKASS